MGYIFNNAESDIEFTYITSEDMLEEVRQLFLEYAQSINIDLSFQDFENELKTLPGKYESPGGEIILALVNGQAAGCVALRKLSPNICEMKRLYVRNNYRGYGIGRKLVAKIIEEARTLGYSYMRLDTLSTMESALYLYNSYGFYEIESYIYNPLEEVKYLELKL